MAALHHYLRLRNSSIEIVPIPLERLRISLTMRFLRLCDTICWITSLMAAAMRSAAHHDGSMGKRQTRSMGIVLELCIVLLTLIAWGIKSGWFHSAK